MKQLICLPMVLLMLLPVILQAQKIIPIEYNGKKYEVLDMLSKGKVM